MNPYDMCCVNNIIYVYQYTLLWQVDGIKLSHKDTYAVIDLIVKLNNQYENNYPLAVTRGKAHGYITMTIYLSVDGKVINIMIYSIINVIYDLPDDMDGKKVTP